MVRFGGSLTVTTETAKRMKTRAGGSSGGVESDRADPYHIGIP